MIEGNDITKLSLALILIIAFGIFFTTDQPQQLQRIQQIRQVTGTCMIVQQQTIAIIKKARIMRRKFKTYPLCNSNMLTFEGLSTSHGEMIQLVNVKSVVLSGKRLDIT
ncbi:hypothetical protein BH18THE2_BH18THE2_34450 [soil metagenome]